MYLYTYPTGPLYLYNLIHNEMLCHDCFICAKLIFIKFKDHEKQINVEKPFTFRN